ncbi:hypothetical protein ACQP2U_43130 (plasmid) [Nocardia sp. CA-084685]|uniref:hypothetical protein n=1 Tax=Nocardia sp. CA-084685 TaxID=3239970 RepID=UPI003D97ED47
MASETGRAEDSALPTVPARSTNLKTRQPTGSCPPLVLFDADPGSWPTMIEMFVAFIAEMGGGHMCWLDIGDERDGDEYLIHVDEPSCVLLEHDGSWDDIVDRIRQVRELALVEAAAGTPTVLVINSISRLNVITRAGTVAQALSSDAATEKIAADPNADIQPQRGHYRSGDARWELLMTMLMEFPGIVLATSRSHPVGGEEPATVAAMFKRPDLPKDFLYQVTACVHMRTGSGPVLAVAKNRHIRGGALHEYSTDLTIAELIYEHLRFDPASTAPRQLHPSVEEMAARLFVAPNLEQLEALLDEYQTRLGSRDNPMLLSAYQKRGQILRLKQMAQELLAAQSIADLDKRYDQVEKQVGREQRIVNDAYTTRRRALLQQLANWVFDAPDLSDLRNRYEHAANRVGSKQPMILRAYNERTEQLQSQIESNQAPASGESDTEGTTDSIQKGLTGAATH